MVSETRDEMQRQAEVAPAPTVNNGSATKNGSDAGGRTVGSQKSNTNPLTKASDQPVYSISRQQGQQKSLKTPQTTPLTLSALEIHNTSFAGQSPLSFEGTKRTQKRGARKERKRRVDKGESWEAVNADMESKGFFQSTSMHPYRNRGPQSGFPTSRVTNSAKPTRRSSRKPRAQQPRPVTVDAG